MVINQELPSAHRGELQAAATPVATEIHEQIASSAPATFGGQALDSETFRQFADTITARNQRLNQMTTGLTSTLWFVLIVGAIINLALLAILGINKPSAHLALSGISRSS